MVILKNKRWTNDGYKHVKKYDNTRYIYIYIIIYSAWADAVGHAQNRKFANSISYPTVLHISHGKLDANSASNWSEGSHWDPHKNIKKSMKAAGQVKMDVAIWIDISQLKGCNDLSTSTRPTLQQLRSWLVLGLRTSYAVASIHSGALARWLGGALRDF